MKKELSLTINSGICFICGEPMLKEDCTKHHLLPKSMKPKHNVCIRLHGECHEKLNNLYVSQEKTSINKKLINVIDDMQKKLELAKGKITTEE